ncbi:MAG: hypothetical protein FWF97_03535 [Alphaproteobacteria bacterium]|nr:hypothetical protein [Alphaproteobacteria bacterium]
MKKIFMICCSLFIVGAIGSAEAAVAAKPKTVSVLNNATTVRAKSAPSGLYQAECYDTYFGCMDQFCISDNESGGTCLCSDENKKFEDSLAKIQKQLDEANRLKTVEVEKVQAGAQADIIFTGGRQYDAQGNVVSVEAAANSRSARRNNLLSMWDDAGGSTDIFSQEIDNIASKTGGALYSAAREMCLDQMPDSCEKDITMLTQLYSTQIKSDCKAFENAVSKSQKMADEELASAQKEVRTALKESFEEANKLDRGTCMVEFKKCMQEEDACGADWTKCVSSIASENMQNQKNEGGKGKAEHVSKYEITDATMEILDSKRFICEKILNQCMAVRDLVWPDFLREAAPDLRLAELNAESKQRQSCLSNISNCIQKACKEDIAGKGVDTMDACLARPEMARQFCKVELEPCERMTKVGAGAQESLIWQFVKDKLASMRVDACTTAVKECYTSPDRCGEDFSKCIGMDYRFLHDLCPQDKLLACQENGRFDRNRVDSMLMGFYLNVDNAALDNCQNLVEKKMLEICGSTTKCDNYLGDEFLGTQSLAYTKNGSQHIVTGMFSIGNIKVGDGMNGLDPGRIDVQDYMREVEIRNGGISIPNRAGVMEAIRAELNNIEGSINRAISLISSDPQIQYCVEGRDLSQVTGGNRGRANTTVGRFPNLLNQTKMVIAESALRKVANNYNAKLTELIAKATKESSADVAEYMCQRLPFSGESPGNDLGYSGAQSDSMGTFAIARIVGEGIDTRDLVRGATSRNTVDFGGAFSMERNRTRARSASSAGMNATTFAMGGSEMIAGGGGGAGGGAGATKSPEGNLGAGAGSGAGIGGGMQALTVGIGGSTYTAAASTSNKSEANEAKLQGGGTQQSIMSVFNRADRICKVCTTTIVNDCSGSILRNGRKLTESCDTKIMEDGGQRCEDIQM